MRLKGEASGRAVDTGACSCRRLLHWSVTATIRALRFGVCAEPRRSSGSKSFAERFTAVYFAVQRAFDPWRSPPTQQF